MYTLLVDDAQTCAAPVILHSGAVLVVNCPIPSWLKSEILYLRAKPSLTFLPKPFTASNELPGDTDQSTPLLLASGLLRIPKLLSVKPVNPLKYKDPYTSNYASYPTLRTISVGVNVSL